MIRLLSTRLTRVWLLLVAATTVSFALGHGVGVANVREAAIGIILVAFVKARYVLLDFMELRQAPKALRQIAQLWLVLAATAIVLTYLFAGPASAD